MNREEIKIKCLELAVDYMNHLNRFQDCRSTNDYIIIKIAENFYDYITKEESKNKSENRFD